MTVRQREQPEVIRTDGFEVRLYRQAAEFSVHRLRIRLGIVGVGPAVFRMRAVDFRLYPGELEKFVEFVKTWRA